MSNEFIVCAMAIAVGGFTIAMTFKQKSRTFIFGGSAVIAFVIGTILEDAAHGVIMAVPSPLLSLAIQNFIKSFKKGIKDLKNLRERMSKVSAFSKTPAQFVERYNFKVDDFVEMLTKFEDRRVDCSALKTLKIVKTVEQTPDSGYFRLQDAPYIKIHWIKGQYDEQLKGVAFAFAMKTVRQDGVDTIDATSFLPVIQYGEEETETIFIHSTVIGLMIYALYNYAINWENWFNNKVCEVKAEINDYVANPFLTLVPENAGVMAAQSKNKVAQENPQIFSGEKRENFEFEGVSFVVIVSNQLSFKELESESELKSNVWIVASKDAGIERRLENEIIGR